MFCLLFFYVNDRNHSISYLLSLHDALPIYRLRTKGGGGPPGRGPVNDARAVFVEAPARLHMGMIDPGGELGRRFGGIGADRKSTRLNSSHLVISYAVFCLKKIIEIESISQP